MKGLKEIKFDEVVVTKKGSFARRKKIMVKKSDLRVLCKYLTRKKELDRRYEINKK